MMESDIMDDESTLERFRLKEGSLNFTSVQVDLVTKYCNSTSCAVKKFDVDPYPGHVDRLGLGASR